MSAATFAVTNTNNAGVGSLRNAIIDANALVGADILETLLIDGTTQPGFAGQPLIELDCSNLAGVSNGLTFTNGHNHQIKSLIINGSSDDAIEIAAGSHDSNIDNCFIGTNSNGTIAVANTGHDINIQNANNITITNSLISSND